MCGLAGSYGEVRPEVAQRMVERLDHRGPVGEGYTDVSGGWLGHRRCAAADVKSGAQPLATETGELTLVGDGAIYNHNALRQTLSTAASRNRSDFEVALHLFNELGPDAFAKLRGMFAFIIAGEDGRFVAVRDPVGIKPLYMASRDGVVRFASEMGAYDEDWLPSVEVFPPGHYWTPQNGLVPYAEAVPGEAKTKEAFERPSEPADDVPEEILAGVRDRLVGAVESQLADLPDDMQVGVLLSGGLDSSLIAAIAARWYRQRGMQLRTFAIGLKGSADLQAAREVTEYLGTDHQEIQYTSEEAVKFVPEVVRSLENFDPSLVRSSVPNFIVSELAARNVDLVLTGEGADELFAGYDYLEDLEDEVELHEELVRGFGEAHNGGLQRVDRVTMAHGLEVQLPFLELDMIELGLSIPADWKRTDAGQPEKRILRQAYQGWLPDELLWRKKAQFGEGSGAIDVLPRKMAQTVSEEEFERERRAVEPPLRTREEAAYYRIFAEHLPGARPERTISRFVTT
jgi:asparagine synthase (glutamine-hydrolysing)